MRRKQMNQIQEQASRGGMARASSLSRERRSEIARLAVEARWEKAGKSRPLRATHAGVLKIGDKEIPCAVLEDGTRLLTQYGYFEAIGRSGKPAAGRGSSIEKVAPFLTLDNIKSFVDKDLADSTTPIVFQTPSGGKAYGYRAETLPRVCEVYLRAREAGVLLKTQLKFAAACELIVRGLAHVGIIALIDEATGFQDDRARDALARILEAFVSKELRKWIKTFPAEFYRHLCRLRGITYDQHTNLPQYFGHLTNNVVYDRLAPGVKQELRQKNPMTPAGYRRSKHHQWLTPYIGHPKLLEHLAAVIALMKISTDWDEFKRLLDKALPVWESLPLFDQALSDSTLPALPSAEV